MTQTGIREQNRYKNSNLPANNKSMSATNKYFISQCLTAYVQGNETLFNTFSPKTRELVESIYNNATKGNQAMLDQLLNRIEGKVKETIDLNTSIKTLQPSQEEIEILENKYRLQPTTINIEQIKSLPNASNAEQIDVNTDNNRQCQKTDTLPDECLVNTQGNSDILLQAEDVDPCYSNKPHIIHRSKNSNI